MKQAIKQVAGVKWRQLAIVTDRTNSLRMNVTPHGNTVSTKGVSVGGANTNFSVLDSQAEVLLNLDKPAKDANGKTMTDAEGKPLKNRDLVRYDLCVRGAKPGNPGEVVTAPLYDGERFVELVSSGTEDFDIYSIDDEPTEEKRPPANNGGGDAVKEPQKEAK